MNLNIGQIIKIWTLILIYVNSIIIWMIIIIKSKVNGLILQLNKRRLTRKIMYLFNNKKAMEAENQTIINT